MLCSPPPLKHRLRANNGRVDTCKAIEKKERLSLRQVNIGCLGRNFVRIVRDFEDVWAGNEDETEGEAGDCAASRPGNTRVVIGPGFDGVCQVRPSASS